MSNPTKMDLSAVASFLKAHPEWEVVNNEKVARDFPFEDFASALGFAVRVGLFAERVNHHPDIEIGWGRARVLWTTHETGGITAKDLELADATDQIFNR